MLTNPLKAVLVSAAFVVILWGNLSVALIAFSTMSGGVLYGAGDFASSRVLPSMAASIFFMGVSGFLPLYLIAFWVKLRWMSRRARIVATSSLFIVCLCAFSVLIWESSNLASILLLFGAVACAVFAAWAAEKVGKKKEQG